MNPLPNYDGSTPDDNQVDLASRRINATDGLSKRLKLLGNCLFVTGVFGMLGSVFALNVFGMLVAIIHGLLGLKAIRAGNAFRRGGSGAEEEENLTDALGSLQSFFTLLMFFFLIAFVIGLVVNLNIRR